MTASTATVVIPSTRRRLVAPAPGYTAAMETTRRGTGPSTMDPDTAPDGRRGADLVRAWALVVVAVGQVAAGAVGGIGLWGEAVGDVANSYPSLLLPGGTAFSIWSVIYVAFLALAVRQVLPAQRGREVHRGSGWWLVGAGVLNMSWVLLFGQRVVLGAQVVIVALLVCLAVAAVRLARTPARGWGDRLLLHTPVSLYLGWVAIATLAGAASLGTYYDAAPSVLVAVVAVVLTGVAAALAVRVLPAVVGFGGAVVWAVAWIAAETEAGEVRIGALVAVALVVVAVVLRVLRARDRAFG